MIVVTSPLLEVCETLNRNDLRYCLLRGDDALESRATSQEVDLLVEPAELRRFAVLVAEHGFVRWPSWGHAPHAFFIRYDAATDAWVKLDVVTSLRFGAPIRALHVDLAPGILAFRRRRGSLQVPAAEHEFLALLLHALLDRGAFRSTQRARLTALWGELINGGGRERCDGTSPGTCTKVISADDDTCKAPTATCNPVGVKSIRETASFGALGSGGNVIQTEGGISFSPLW